MAPKPPKPKTKAKPKASLDVRIKTDAALRKRVLANPGLRSKLSVSSLQKYAPQQAQARALSARLNQPITPGSSTTERDLAHEARAAQTVRYQPQETAIGQQLGVAQQVERDTGSFYDQYRQALQDHAARVQAFQAGAQQAQQQLQAGITGLGQDQAAQMQQQANAAATPGVAPAGDLTQLANQALSQRQQFAGTFGAQQAQTGAAANTYADTLANVVAPTQKLSAQAQARGRTGDVRQKQADLRAEEGAFNEQFRAQRRQDEFKNVLAMGALNLNQTKAQADIAAKATSAAQNTPEAAAAKTSATASATQAAKYGYTAHQWALLGPTARNKIIAKAKKTSSGSGAADTVYTSGPFAGRKKSEIAALSDQQRQQIVKDYNAGKGSDGKPKDGKGPGWQTAQRQSAARTQVASLKRYAQMAKSGQPFVPGHGKPQPLPRNGPNSASAKIQASVAAPDDPALLTAALDAVYVGSLTASTVKKLIAAGYKPSLIASALGVPTGGSARAARPTRPGSGPARARQ